MCNLLRTRRSVRGFSLLEVMIVLVLMVGLLAIAWPNLQRPLRRTTLNEAAQVLREAIDEGRHAAIATGEPIFVQMQQGNHEVRTGSFANFTNTDDLGASAKESSLGAGTFPSAVHRNHAESRHGLGTENHSDGATPRTWRLPDSIVIAEVNWTSELVTDEVNGSTLPSTSDSLANDAKGSWIEDSDTAKIGSTDSEAAIAAMGTSHNDWWLPISATGQSRSASIVLYDTSIHEKITLTYASATGALEIVR